MKEYRHFHKRKLKKYALVDYRQIGGRMLRIVNWESAKIKDGSVWVAVRPWIEGDGACCPTGNGTIEITIDTNFRLQIVDAQNPSVSARMWRP